MAPRKVRKHFQLDPAKIKRAQKALRARTETEAIERALDLVITGHESGRSDPGENERFVATGKETKGFLAGLGTISGDIISPALSGKDWIKLGR